jgi:hypothetical protein
MRILVAVSPLMYREAIALSLHQHRPGFEVRLAPPEAAQEQVREFGPHLLVRHDADGLDPEVLDGVPFWVEVRYSDSMSATIDSTYEVRDISTEGLLRAVDEAAAWLGGA